MPSPAAGCEGRAAMIEPLIGLIVGISLGVYLLYTLLHPEKF
jgi:K+-transporting ATPase KdpF subunit